MPTYDYRCDANDRVIEVRHGMKESLATWGELCECAGVAPGDTPLASPVQRLATGGQVVKRASLGEADAPACARPGCGGGVCGMS